MIIVTSEQVAGHRVVQSLGLVQGSSYCNRSGIPAEDAKALAQSRKSAVKQMVEEAEALGANGVVAVRFQSTASATTGTENLCYGTAVKLRQEE